MSNLGGICFVLLLLVISVYTFNQPNALNPWDRTCCGFNTGACDGLDQYYYLYVPGDVQFNCEDIIQNSNRYHFYSETYNSPASNVHPDFSGYAWELNGCHIFPTVPGPCNNLVTNNWCSIDDDVLFDFCDDDDDGGGVNTWMRTWSDVVTVHDTDQCPYQFTITRTWRTQTTCRAFAPPAQVASNQLIYVVDQIPPNLEIPADLTIECPTNFVPDYTLGQSTAVDQCTTTSVRYSSTLANTFAGCNAGTLTRTFTASDRCGNSIADTQTITIVDTTPPIIPQLPTVTTTCTDTGTSTTGTPGAVPYYRCEQFIPAGPSYTDFTAGTCATRTNSFGCNQVTAGQGRTFTLTVPIGAITLEFNDLKLEGRGILRVYDGASSASPLLITISSPAPPATPPTPLPADNPGPITGSGSSLFVEYVPNTAGDATIIDGYSGFFYGHKTVPDTTATATFSDARINGPCEGTYTISRTWYATDECRNQGSMTQTIFVVDNTPPTTNPPFPPQTNIVEEVDCLADFVSFTLAPVDSCSPTGATLTKQVTLGGASGQNFAFAIIQTFTATDGCDNTITWSYTQEIGYYPIYISGVLPPYITGQPKASPFTLSVGIAEISNFLNYVQGNSNPTFCTSPVVVVADAGPALLSAGSDPCWTQAAGGLLYCETTTTTIFGLLPIDLVLTVPADYAPSSLIISFTVAERAILEVDFVPIFGAIFGTPTSDNVVITFA